MAPNPFSSSKGSDGPDSNSGTSITKRISNSLFKPPKPKVEGEEKAERDMTDEEKAAAIRQIDPLEQKIGYLAAALVAIIGLIAFLPYVDDPKKSINQTLKRSGNACPSGFKTTVVKGVHDCTGPVVYSRSHWLVEMLILLFFAAFIFVAVRIGRRSALAFATFLSGLAVEGTTGSIIGLAFVGAGGWMILRAWRVQRYGSPTAKNAASAAAAGARPARPRRGKKGETTSTTPSAPQQSKRYTPKAAPAKSAAKNTGSRYDSTKTNGAKSNGAKSNGAKSNGTKGSTKRPTPPPA